MGLASVSIADSGTQQPQGNVSYASWNITARFRVCDRIYSGCFLPGILTTHNLQTEGSYP
jgi:hypothetical protein